jgi:hypothetical protein
MRSGSNNTGFAQGSAFSGSHFMKLSLEISVSYRSGLVKGTFMQAWFRVGL